MQSRATFALILTTVGFAAFMSGCIVIGNPNDNSGGSGGSGGRETVGVTTTGTGGTGGTGGQSTGGGGTGGSGGAGGGTSCVGPDEGGATVASCDAMNITPATQGGSASQCTDMGATFNPPGYDLCKHIFDIYTKGAASYVQSCLSKIGVEPANACDQAQVDACATSVYAAVCPNATAASTCQTIGSSCSTAGQAFDTQLCQTSLNPFNDTAITDLVGCFNTADPTLTCQAAFDDCYKKSTAY